MREDKPIDRRTSRALMHARSAGLLLLLLASGMANGSPVPKSPGGPVQILALPTRIEAVASYPGSRQSRFLIAQADPRDQGMFHLLALELPTGKRAQVGSFRSVMSSTTLRGRVACSADGTVAVAATPSLDEGDVVQVRRAGGHWQPLHKPASAARPLSGWNPRATSLLYAECRLPTVEETPATWEGLSLSLHVAEEASGGRFTDRTALAGLPTNSEAAWSADGKCVYCLANTGPRPDWHGQILAIDWPSGTKHIVFASTYVSSLSVAEESGDVVWLALAQGRPAESPSVWRMTPGGEPERTPVSLPPGVRQAVVSPDGTRLAVVSESGNLAVCSLSSGRRSSPARPTKRAVRDVLWAMDGRGLLAVVGERQLWLVPLAAPGGGPLAQQ